MNSSDAANAPQSEAQRTAHLELGRRGEELAVAWLEQQGYAIVAANFTVPVGRNIRGAIVHAEIDLVAYEGTTLCFVEVKTRASDWFAPPQANVDLRKQRQISRAARAYRRMFGLESSSWRYDVVTVLLPAGTDLSGPLQIEVLRNFWTEEKLRKCRWAERYWE